MRNQMLDLSRINFMVVDDNANMRKILDYILRVLGAEHVATANDPADAFTSLKTFSADIVITNWMMEPLDGIDFARLLRTASDSPSPTVPIIMVSGHTEIAKVTEARDAGVTEFLAKPVSPKALYLRIREVILNPRKFVKTKTFYGPDRQRRIEDLYLGSRRRKSDKTETEAEGLTAEEVDNLLEK